MSTRSAKTITISLPTQLVAELDRMREREHRTASKFCAKLFMSGRASNS
jgi:metal-responsive CopG/Arc/MetJ family transcriptional regulator